MTATICVNSGCGGIPSARSRKGYCSTCAKNARAAWSAMIADKASEREDRDAGFLELFLRANAAGRAAVDRRRGTHGRSAGRRSRRADARHAGDRWPRPDPRHRPARPRHGASHDPPATAAADAALRRARRWPRGDDAVRDRRRLGRASPRGRLAAVADDRVRRRSWAARRRGPGGTPDRARGRGPVLR